MSIADGLRVIALERTVAVLVKRLDALEARQGAETPAGATSDHAPPTQRPSSAPADDAVMAEVVAALQAGESIRGAAKVVGLDRNKIARLRRRALAEGRLTSRPGETGLRKPTDGL
jgi:hypothetical protein